MVFDVELMSIDGNMDATGGLANGMRVAFGLIAANALTLAVMGHELREYTDGSM